MRSNGFSLIEVLISILLLSLLIATSMYGFKFFTTNLKKYDFKTPKMAINYELLSKSIKGTFYYEIDDKDEFGNISKRYYNLPKSKEYTYITTNPIYSDKISVASLSCSESKLIYKEKKLYTHNNNYIFPNIENPEVSEIIVDELENCVFEYKYRDENIDIPSLVVFKYSKLHVEKKWIFYVFSNFHKHKDYLFSKRTDM